MERMPVEGGVGIVAGSGVLPLAIAQAVRRRGDGEARVVAVGHLDETDPALAEWVDEMGWVRLGQFGKIIRYLSRWGVSRVVMAGGIRKAAIWRMRPDWTAWRLALRVSNWHDDALLRAVAGELTRRGFQVVGVPEFLPEWVVGAAQGQGEEHDAPSGQAAGRAAAPPTPCLGWQEAGGAAPYPAGGDNPPRAPLKMDGNLVFPACVLGAVVPSDAAREGMRLGFRLAKELGRLDIGQGLVVRGKVVVAVEAMEGTDAMIRRAGELVAGKGPLARSSQAVLVKVCKPEQDRRLDLPTVGPGTVEALHQAGIVNLLLEAGGVLMLEPEKTLRLADQYGIAVVAGGS